MSVLFNHAWRYELFDRNPIKLVRQSAKRRASPNVLIPAEIKLLLDNLELRERTLVLVAVSTGLRQSELFALKWGDIDFSQGHERDAFDRLWHRRSMQDRGIAEAGSCPSILAAALIDWRDRCKYREPDDWVFANEHHRGRIPYWGQAILRRIIRPVAERLGIKRRIGWNTFRHTYSTLLRSVGTEFKVMQELLRLSSLRSTIDIYTQAVTLAKHAAHAAVLSLVFPVDQLVEVQSAEFEKPDHRANAAASR